MKINGWHYSVIALLIGFSIGALFGGIETLGLRKIPVSNNGLPKVATEKGMHELLSIVLSGSERDARMALLRISHVDSPKVDNIFTSIYEDGRIKGIGGKQDRLALPSIRLRVAQILVEKRSENPERYVSYIFQHVSSSDDKIRAYSANALGSVKNKKAVDKLVEIIKLDTNYVASNAIASLQRIASGKGAVSTYALSQLKTLGRDIDAWDPILRYEVRSAYVEAKKFRSQWKNKDMEQR